MAPKTKTELISIAHTFIAIFSAAVMANINTLDVAHLSKDALVAFGVAVFRSIVKSVWLYYFPNETPNVVTNQNA